MKMKAIEILNICDSLSVLADKELDLDTACIIAGNIKGLSVAKEVIDKKRDALIKEYAEKNGDGNVVQKDDGSIKINDGKAFSVKLNELLASEADVGITDIPKDALKEIKVSPKDLLPLMDFIK